MSVLNREFVNWRELRIHESSPGSPLLQKFRRECPRYVASHFYPELPRGTKRDGFISQDLEHQSFESSSFDLVITQDVLEHIFDPRAAFNEIARTLTPGGAHVFTVPWYYWKPTVVRARRTPTGVVEHLLEPDYHGNPIRPNARSLVVTEWGRDLLEFIDSCSGVQTEVIRLDDAELGITGAFVDVFVSRRPLGRN
jgi:SAM-dependent methyltransferase